MHTFLLSDLNEMRKIEFEKIRQRLNTIKYSKLLRKRTEMILETINNHKLKIKNMEFNKADFYGILNLEW